MRVPGCFLAYSRLVSLRKSYATHTTTGLWTRQFSSQTGSVAAAGENKFPPSKRLYVGGFDVATGNELKSIFSKYGEIEGIDVPFEWNGTGHGYAFLTFASETDAMSAYTSAVEEPIYLKDVPLKVQWAGPRVTPDYVRPPSRRIFFRDFPGDDVDMRRIFAKRQHWIDQIKFHRKTGKSTGSGFVIFGRMKQARTAMKDLKKRKAPEIVKYSMDFARYRKAENSRA